VKASPPLCLLRKTVSDHDHRMRRYGALEARMRIKCRLLVDELARLFLAKRLLELLQIADVNELSVVQNRGRRFRPISPLVFDLRNRIKPQFPRQQIRKAKSETADKPSRFAT
jgi:hypothetical protein